MKLKYEKYVARSTAKMCNNFDIYKVHSLFKGIEKASEDIIKDIFK